MWESWKPYKFNFDGAAFPLAGELNVLSDVVIGFANVEHFICYLVAGNEPHLNGELYTVIEEPIFIMTLSTSNAAHSLCELMSFIGFYLGSGSNLKIGVNTIIEERLPFIYQILGLFVRADRIIRLDAAAKYRIRRGWLRRNSHFNPVINWNEIPFRKTGDLLVFEDLGRDRLRFLDDPRRLFEKSDEIFHRNETRINKHDRIMLVKTMGEPSSTTPSRGTTLGEAARCRVEAAGIEVFSVNDFADIYQYIYTLRSAKLFITSYGGAACTNRFFLSPDAQVILLANKSYKWEYDYPVPDGEYWHIRHSHLFPVKRQTVILDHDDDITLESIERIIKLADGATS